MSNYEIGNKYARSYEVCMMLYKGIEKKIMSRKETIMLKMTPQKKKE
jgi:hypothetical protein